MPKYNLRVNGSVRTVDSSDPDQPLLYVLRGLDLTATKFGCGLGQCGACTVLADGTAVQSCLMTVANAQGKAITTLEGSGRHPNRIRSRPPSSMSRCRNAATARAA
jgi:aerobic-type carbon monoxide dehydrogenase small subunit (CoxS/CutS family)